MDVVRELLSYGAFADVVEGDLDERSIECTPDIQTAFLWYENVHVASDVRVGQRTSSKWRKHEALVYPFWREGRSAQHSGWLMQAAGCCPDEKLKTPKSFSYCGLTRDITQIYGQDLPEPPPATSLMDARSSTEGLWAGFWPAIASDSMVLTLGIETARVVI